MTLGQQQRQQGLQGTPPLQEAATAVASYPLPPQGPSTLPLLKLPTL
jgi:hypothetical protein